MRLIFRHLFGALCLGLVSSAAVSAGGMDEPVAEPVTVVVTSVVLPPTTEPVFSGVYLPRVLSVADLHGSGGDRSPDAVGISMSSDGRVMCFTVAQSRRGNARAFDLCHP